MAVTVTNLIQGPGTLYRGAAYTGAYSDADEPANSAVNTTPQATAYTDVGGTSDGMNLEIGREYAELAVDQIVDIPDRRLTKREFSFATNLAEATLENLAFAMNDTQPSSGSGFKYFEPTNTSAASQPTWVPLLFDGYAPSSYRRRVLGRRMLGIDPIQFAYKKDAQTVWTVKFAGHYVSESIAPWKIVDQTS